MYLRKLTFKLTNLYHTQAVIEDADPNSEPVNREVRIFCVCLTRVDVIMNGHNCR